MYLPPDTNTLLSTMNHCLRSRNYVNVVVAGKQPVLDLLDAEQARLHCTRGIGMFSGPAPMAALSPMLCWHVPGMCRREILAATAILREHLPELRVRVVNVVDLMRLLPHSNTRTGCAIRVRRAVHHRQTRHLQLPRLPVADPSTDVLPQRTQQHARARLQGGGTTTTPFDMCVMNDIDRFHLVIDVIDRVPGLGPMPPGCGRRWWTSGWSTGPTSASAARTCRGAGVGLALLRRRRPTRASSVESVKDLGSADITRLYREEYAHALNALGRFNLAIFSKTGTGKSTLVNAIFGGDVAAVGTGRPVTTGLDYYVHPNGVLGIYDSRGFETGEASDRILAALEDIVDTARKADAAEQIHAAWYTLRWSDRRFEDHQAGFVRRLQELGLPVLFVLTQVPANAQGQIHDEAIDFARYIAGLGLPLAADGRVFLTNAKADQFLGTVVFGLQELLDATFDTIPEVAVAALSAAQQLDWGRKDRLLKRSLQQARRLPWPPVPPRFRFPTRRS